MATMKPTLCGGRAVHAPDCGEDGNCEYYAERAEAWAVGTVGGDPVPSYDLAYENNSKYWAEQSALSASESAESAIESTESATQAKGHAETAEQAAEEVTNALGQVMSKTTGIFTQTFTTSTDTDTLTFNPTGYTYSANDDFDVYISGLRLNPSEFSWTGSGSSATITLVTPVTHTGTVIEVVANTSSQMTTDATLTIQGAAADAKATGDEINQLKEDLTAIAIRPTVSGSIASFNDGAEDVPMKSLVVNIEPVQSGSGDPSPSNIRPISGWNAVEINRIGKNLLNYDAWKTVTGIRCSLVWENNGVTITATGNDAYTAYGNMPQASLIQVKEGIVITLSWEESTNNSGTVYILDQNNRVVASANNSTAKQIIYTVESGVNLLKYRFGVAQSGVSISYKNIMFRITGDNTFEPYAANTITNQLPTTVYGGRLDVVSGELVIDTAIQRITSFGGKSGFSNVDMGYTTAYNALIDPTGLTTGTPPSVYKCNIGKTVALNGDTSIQSGAYDNEVVFTVDYIAAAEVRVSFPKSIGLDTLAKLNQYLTDNEVYFSYRSSTKTTVQLTPQEVTTLLGANNVFADAGSVNVIYCADGKLYIDNRIAELQALVLEQ